MEAEKRLGQFDQCSHEMPARSHDRIRPICGGFDRHSIHSGTGSGLGLSWNTLGRRCHGTEELVPSLEAEAGLTSFIAYVFSASCISYIVEEAEELISLLITISEGSISKRNVLECVANDWAILS